MLESPSSTGRQLLQYYGGYYGNNYWSGGRIAGVVIGIICFALAIFFLILSILLRRRRLARTQVCMAGSLAYAASMHV